MINRKMNLVKMSSHPMLKKLFDKLNQKELDAVTAFINENEHLNDNEYMHKANRWYLDQEKPKNYSDMWAIITQCK